MIGYKVCHNTKGVHGNSIPSVSGFFSNMPCFQVSKFVRPFIYLGVRSNLSHLLFIVYRKLSHHVTIIFTVTYIFTFFTLVDCNLASMNWIFDPKGL